MEHRAENSRAFLQYTQCPLGSPTSAPGPILRGAASVSARCTAWPQLSLPSLVSALRPLAAPLSPSHISQWELVDNARFLQRSQRRPSTICVVPCPAIADSIFWAVVPCGTFYEGSQFSQSTSMKIKINFEVRNPLHVLTPYLSSGS